MKAPETTSAIKTEERVQRENEKNWGDRRWNECGGRDEDGADRVTYLTDTSPDVQIRI